MIRYLFIFSCDVSIYHALGFGTFHYLKAVMTFEQVYLLSGRCEGGGVRDSELMNILCLFYVQLTIIIFYVKIARKSSKKYIQRTH